MKKIFKRKNNKNERVCRVSELRIGGTAPWGALQVSSNIVMLFLIYSFNYCEI